MRLQTVCASVCVCQASQREFRAMETMTAAFIHKFPRVTPELFVDLSQFIPFMSVSDIKSFPASLMVNDSVYVVGSSDRQNTVTLCPDASVSL